MRAIILCCLLAAGFSTAFAQTQPLQKPCATIPEYRQFDFWLGEWEVFATNGNKAGQAGSV